MKKLGMIYLMTILAISNVAQADEDVEALDKKAVALYLKNHDANGDGLVSADEYVDWKAVKSNFSHLEAGIRSGFLQADLNGDGYLDSAEIKAIFERRRESIRLQDK